jgi:osmotically-inducible protein OsmY
MVASRTEDPMGADSELRHTIERELEWDPRVPDRRIGVAVLDGIVTLTGGVSSYSQKWYAERAAERVKGVRGIVNKIEVKSPHERSDLDIARDAVEALKANVIVPHHSIRVRVANGRLTLEGQVDWDFQRRAAERAVRSLRGVRDIRNLVEVKPRVEPRKVKQRIIESFERAALIDPNNIFVEVAGSEVTLRGRVRSWRERAEAERAAWAAPGVTHVRNHIVIDPALDRVFADQIRETHGA